tara:strand:- start:83 stop:400 length:318 start_codon:yes stop_codon:yes gene_type:complete
MIIRLVFEPETNVNCNHDDMFRYYSENYLSDFNTTWGGYITISASEMVHSDTIANQPCYQRYVPGVEGTQKTLDKILEYVKINPMAGYTTHIYANPEGGNEVKII